MSSAYFQCRKRINVGMTVMAKVITTAEICENAKMARDMALAGEYAMHSQPCVRRSDDILACVYVLERRLVAHATLIHRQLWWREHLLRGIDSITAAIYWHTFGSAAEGQMDNGQFLQKCFRALWHFVWIWTHCITCHFTGSTTSEQGIPTDEVHTERTQRNVDGPAQRAVAPSGDERRKRIQRPGGLVSTGPRCVGAASEPWSGRVCTANRSVLFIRKKMPISITRRCKSREYGHIFENITNPCPVLDGLCNDRTPTAKVTTARAHRRRSRAAANRPKKETPLRLSQTQAAIANGQRSMVMESLVRGKMMNRGKKSRPMKKRSLRRAITWKAI